MVTVEADVVVGYPLGKLADDAGVLYSAAYGDEPALALELWDWASVLGFRVIAARKGTRFMAAFKKANPDDVPKVYGFTGKDYNAQMFGSFLDGTKHAIEMAALANMSGLVPDVRGMHFPSVDLREIPDKLAHRDKRGHSRAGGHRRSDQFHRFERRGRRTEYSGRTLLCRRRSDVFYHRIPRFVRRDHRPAQRLFYDLQTAALVRSRDAYRHRANDAEQRDLWETHRPVRRSRSRCQEASPCWHGSRRRERLLRLWIDREGGCGQGGKPAACRVFSESSCEPRYS